MATFLALCQDVARESGTFPNIGDPLSVEGQSGRLLRLVNWVNQAWAEIQREQDNWRWMMSEATGDTVAGVTGYAGSALGVASRFDEWRPFENGEDCEVSCWDPSVGRSDEGFLRFVPWMEFRHNYQSGSATADTGKPSVVSVAPNGELTVYPTPDKAYKLRCPYRKSVQTLLVNADTPEMPERYHPAIQWKALVLLGTFDEATQQKAEWQSFYGRTMGHLRNSQLPQMRHGGPIA